MGRREPNRYAQRMSRPGVSHTVTSRPGCKVIPARPDRPSDMNEGPGVPAPRPSPDGRPSHPAESKRGRAVMAAAIVRPCVQVRTHHRHTPRCTAAFRCSRVSPADPLDVTPSRRRAVTPSCRSPRCCICGPSPRKPHPHVDVRSKRGPRRRGQAPDVTPCSRCARPVLLSHPADRRLTPASWSAIPPGVVVWAGRTPTRSEHPPRSGPPVPVAAAGPALVRGAR